MASKSYTLLEPNLTKDLGGENFNFNTSNSSSFFASTSFIYVFAISIIIVAAALRYAYAGMLRIDASESGIKKSKEEFTRVTYGLLGVLGLWLILFTVNKDMLTGDVTLSNLTSSSTVSVSSNASNLQTSLSKPFIPKNNDDPVGWKAIENDPVVRAKLKNLPNGGIGVKKSVCMTPVYTSCTTVGGLPESTITMLTSLRSTCSGVISITGGSEAGHSSHGPNKTPVDLSISSPGGLEACIRGFEKGPTVSFCKNTYVNFGYIFCDERGTPHWHVYKQ